MENAVKGPKSWRNVEIEQDVSRGFSDVWIGLFLENWKPVAKWAWVLHDKDKTADGADRLPHIHLMIAFKSPVPTEAILARAKLVSAVDPPVTVQQFQKIRSWASACAYLTHENAPDKFRYPDSDVHANFDVQHESQNAKGVQENVFEDLAAGIESGTIREYNIPDYISIAFYARNRKRIENMFLYQYQKLSVKADRKMQVFYFWGPSGVGKTTTAKDMAQKRGWSYCISSSSNDPLQDYKGQDVLILDDFRPSDWNFSDFLKLTDNHTSSTVKARYSNRQMVYCKAIYITSTLPPAEQVAAFKGSAGEDRQQFLRRISAVVMFNEEKVSVYKDGAFQFDFENPVLHMQDDSEKEQAAIRDAFSMYAPVQGEFHFSGRVENAKVQGQMSFEIPPSDKLNT